MTSSVFQPSRELNVLSNGNPGSLQAFSRKSALAHIVQVAWHRLSSWRRTLRKGPATFALIEELAERSRAAGAAFAVVHVGLHEEVSDGYSEFFEESGIQLVPCVTKVGPELSVPGEGHPNGVAHKRFAKCIWQEIDQLLTGARAPLASNTRTRRSPGRP